MKKQSKNKTIAVFEGNQIRRHWDEEKELWYFSVVDVVCVLGASEDPRNYWKVLKNRLKHEGSEVVTKCNQLKIQASDEGERWDFLARITVKYPYNEAFSSFFYNLLI